MTVEEYGFVFPGVFDGPRWATYPIPPRWQRLLRLDRLRREPAIPRGHVAELCVDEASPLGDVLNAAASTFEISLGQQALEIYPEAKVADLVDGVAFRQGEDAGTWIPKWRFVNRLPVIAADGALHIVTFREADISGLRRASAAGLIDGEVLHPYLRPTVSAGAFGWVASEWDHIALAYLVLKEALDNLDRGRTLLGVVRQGRTFLQTLMRSGNAVEATAPGLSERGIRPHELEALLDRREWTLEAASELLAIPEMEAAAFLTALGYEADERAMWRPAISETGQVTRAALDVVTHSEVIVEEAVEARIRYSVEFVLRTGERPPLKEVFDDAVWTWPHEADGVRDDEDED